MIVKVTKSSAKWFVTINGETVNLATWANGQYVGQAEAIAKAQAYLVAQHAADLA